MKKITLIVSLLSFFVVTGASAHGPVRQKVKETIQINATPDKVWSIIKNFDDMSWLPAVKNTKAEGDNKAGATRVLTLKNGGTITEKLKKYKEDKMTYAYKITEMSTAKTITHSGKEEQVPVLPVSNYAASISVKAKGDGSVVTWKAGYYRAYMNNNPPEEMNEAAANTAVTAILKEGLENLKTLAEK
jgi:carbon monoxide dehydrogenase subunit G